MSESPTPTPTPVDHVAAALAVYDARTLDARADLEAALLALPEPAPGEPDPPMALWTALARCGCSLGSVPIRIFEALHALQPPSGEPTP